MPTERELNTEILYIPFSEDAGFIDISGVDVFKYISKDMVDRIINNLSENIKMDDFEHVLVNMNGGKFLFDKLSKLQNYTSPPILIEYHRPEGGFGAKIDIPIPPGVKNKKCLVVDDIYDSGGVLSAIMKDLSPDSEAVVLITKKDIQNQILITNIKIGVRIDNVWIGGCGMDMGVVNEKERFRSLPEIVVKNAS